MSEALRFHRWPMWTLGSQRGMMVGSPRRLKASLEPSRQDLSLDPNRAARPCKRTRGGKGLTSHSASQMCSHRAPACCCSEI